MTALLLIVLAIATVVAVGAFVSMRRHPSIDDLEPLDDFWVPR